MSNENNTTIIDETKTSEVIDDVVSAAAKRADENEDISHLRDIMSSENENDELTSDSAVFGIKEDGKPDFSSPIKNNAELKEADLDIDEIDSIDEINDKNISDSVVNGDTAKIMDLTDEEADNIAIFGAVLLDLAPYTVLLTCLVVPFVWKQTKLYLAKQIKKETFICAVRILAVGSFVQVITYALGIMIDF